MLKKIILSTTIIFAQDYGLDYGLESSYSIGSNVGSTTYIIGNKTLIEINQVGSQAVIKVRGDGKKYEFSSSYYDRSSSADYGQIWENTTEWDELPFERSYIPFEEIGRLRYRTQSDSLDLSGGRIRQNKPR